MDLPNQEEGYFVAGSGFVVHSGSDDGLPGSAAEETEALTIDKRIEALEGSIERLKSEVRTSRVVVEDDEGRPRVVIETVDGAAELRLELPGSAEGKRTALLLFSAEGRESTGYAAAIGLELWVEGNEVSAYAAWRHPDGRWQTDIETGSI
jgi:hypothetical protein